MPDDLPRSPTGRVPQWVIDEANGARTPGTSWRSYDLGHDPVPARRKRSRRRGMAVFAVALAAGALGGVWALTSGTLTVPSAITAALPAGITDPGTQPAPAPAPPPSADVVALADAAHLSDVGRALFYGTQPQILDAATFAGQCSRGHAASAMRTDGAVGCYDPGANTIVIYAPSDPRLYGYTVETAAHETLHAAWEQLDDATQRRMSALLEAEVATLPSDSDIHQQIAGSVGEVPASRATELFAYIGTQVWRDGGLAGELEATYATYVADRGALVAVHTTWVGTLEALRTDIETASLALAGAEATNANDRAQLDADRASVDFYRQSYDTKVAEVAAMSPEQAERLLLSWTWWDGTDLPMADAADTLASAARLLERDDADLAARAGAVQSAEDSAAAERARVASLITDLQALQAQLNPAAGA